MNLSADMTIIEIDNLIKSLPKERLQKELESPTGHFPLYLVAGRLKEMESMEADAQAAAAEKNTSGQAPSVAHRLAMSQPPVMSEIAGAPQPRPPPDPAGQAAKMLTPTVNAKEGYSESKLVNQYLAELKSRRDKATDKRLRTDEFAVDNRGGFAQNMGKQPFGKGGIPLEGGLADLFAAKAEKEKTFDPTPTPSDQKTQGRFTGGVSRTHGQMVDSSKKTDFDKLLAELIEESGKKRGTRSGNQGGYVNNLPTLYAQSGRAGTYDESRTAEMVATLPGFRQRLLDYEVDRARKAMEQVHSQRVRAPALSTLDAYETRAKADLEAQLAKRSEFYETAGALAHENRKLPSALENPPRKPVWPPQQVPSKTSGSTSDAAAANGSPATNIEFGKPTSDAVVANNQSLTEAGTFKVPTDPKRELQSVYQEKKARQNDTEASRIPIKKPLPPPVLLPPVIENVSKKLQFPDDPELIALRKHEKRILEAGDRQYKVYVKNAGEAFALKQKNSLMNSQGLPSVKAKIAARIAQLNAPPIVAAAKTKRTDPNIVSPQMPKGGFGELPGYTIPSPASEKPEKKRKAETVPFKAGAQDVFNKFDEKNKIRLARNIEVGSDKKINASKSNKIVNTFAAELKKQGTRLDQILGDRKSVYNEIKGAITAKGKTAKEQLEILESSQKAINNFTETGKLPKARRDRMINNMLITMGASLLGNPTMAGALSKGLLAIQKIRSGEEDAYADGLAKNLDAAKKLGDLRIKISDTKQQGLIELAKLKQADSKFDFEAVQRHTSNLLKLKQIEENAKTNSINAAANQMNAQTNQFKALNDPKIVVPQEYYNSQYNKYRDEYIAALGKDKNQAAADAVTQNWKMWFSINSKTGILDPDRPNLKTFQPLISQDARLKKSSLYPNLPYDKFTRTKTRDDAQDKRQRRIDHQNWMQSKNRRNLHKPFWEKHLKEKYGKWTGSSEQKSILSDSYMNFLESGSPVAASPRAKRVYDPNKKSVTEK